MCFRSDQKSKQKEQGKIRLTRNTPRNQEKPGDRDHFDTACDKARPRRWPTPYRFHRSQVRGSRICIALVISKNDEWYTRTHSPTKKPNNGTLCAPRYEKAFLSAGKKRPRSLRSLGLASLLAERLMMQGGLILAAGRVRSKKK